MEIRKAFPEDIDRITEIYAFARKCMEESGNPTQWVNGYPSKELILNDIKNDGCYVCYSEGQLAGVFYFKQENDPTYEKIYDGQWLNNAPYGVVHRIASNGKVKGMATFCLQWCFGQHPNIKVDTHQDNTVMQTVLAKNGFVKCGIIYTDNGTERIAFQKSKSQ